MHDMHGMYFKHLGRTLGPSNHYLDNKNSLPDAGANETLHGVVATKLALCVVLVMLMQFEVLGH